MPANGRWDLIRRLKVNSVTKVSTRKKNIAPLKPYVLVNNADITKSSPYHTLTPIRSLDL